MKIVVVGSGGREHALAHTLRRHGHEVVVTPGRAGIPGSVNTSPEDIKADLFIVGPEQPLVEGLADRLRAQGKVVLGPSAAGARLEGSKIWMKQVLQAAGVPTAEFGAFFSDHQVEAERFLRSQMPPPWAIKTDYLASGKGVKVTAVVEDGVSDVLAKLMLGGVVIERGLVGPDNREMSFFALCSGAGWVPLPSAQDYKRLEDGDQGHMTGGMGAFSPVPNDPGFAVWGPIIDATLAELRRRGVDYRGFLYGGVMLTPDPYVLEYNIRLGDPEAQVILPRIRGDIANAFYMAANGQTPIELSEYPKACVTVVLACEGYGYPEGPNTGDVITGIEAANELDGVMVFHAGTALNDQDQFVTAGGRVLNVTAQAPTVPEARELAYRAVKLIEFRGMQYRSDIAAGVD